MVLVPMHTHDLPVKITVRLPAAQMGASFSAEEFTEAAQQAVEHGGAHATTMEAVARIRKLPWPRTQPAS
jgi:hypothetical protein